MSDSIKSFSFKKLINKFKKKRKEKKKETYCTVDVEDIWKTQSKLQFAHGSNQSCGVMILVRSGPDFNIKSVNLDCEGCSIIMEAEVQLLLLE